MDTDTEDQYVHVGINDDMLEVLQTTGCHQDAVNNIVAGVSALLANGVTLPELMDVTSKAILLGQEISDFMNSEVS